jgi:hypothetical protein
LGEERKVYKVLVGKPEGKRPLGIPRRRWEDGIRMDLGETGWGSVEWIQLAQDRDRWWTCEYGDEPADSGTAVQRHRVSVAGIMSLNILGNPRDD